MDSMSGCDIRVVFSFPPKDSTLQYKKAYTFEITFLALIPWAWVKEGVQWRERGGGEVMYREQI